MPAQLQAGYTLPPPAEDSMPMTTYADLAADLDAARERIRSAQERLREVEDVPPQLDGLGYTLKTLRVDLSGLAATVRGHAR